LQLGDADQTKFSYLQRLIYLRTECSERKKRRGPNRKKSAKSNMVDNLRYEFDPHHHLRRKASVRPHNGAMISPLLNLRAEQVCQPMP
jgi:hypothetical protein